MNKNKTKQTYINTSMALSLMEGYNKYALALFMIMIIVAASEAIGLTMLLPLFSMLIGKNISLGPIAFFAEHIINNFTAENSLFIIFSITIVIFFIKSILLIVHSGLSAHFAMRLREKWTKKIFSSYLRSDFHYAMNQKQGVMIHNTISEPFQTSKSVIDFLDLISKLIMSIAIYIVLLGTNWKATLILSAIGALIIFLLRKSTLHYSIEFGKQRLAISQKATNIATEGVGALKEIKMLVMEKQYISSLSEQLFDFTRVQTKFSIYSHLPYNLLEFIFIVFVAGVIFCVKWFTPNSIQNVVPFIGFFLISGQKLFKYVTYIISQRMKFTSSIPSFQLIYSLISHESDAERLDDGIDFQKLTDDIVFKDVNFSYDNQRSVLNNFCLRIPLNKMTALIGPSGIGKSTVADLIMRLLEPQSGEILVGDTNIKCFNLLTWRKKIGYVPQQPCLFNLSIKDNILLGKPGADFDEVVKAAQSANIHNFIVSLEEGYDTFVGDRGIKLSGGQRQRIVIARAIINNPELLIFDEATSSLDEEGEAIVQKSIDDLSGQKTIIVIAHRLSTIKKADIVCDIGEMSNARVKKSCIQMDPERNN